MSSDREIHEYAAQLAAAKDWRIVARNLPLAAGGDLPYDFYLSDNNVLAVTFSIPSEAPTRVIQILEDRRDATLTGRCVRCDAVTGAQDGQATMAHEPWCPLSNERVARLIRRHRKVLVYGPSWEAWDEMRRENAS